MLKKDKVAFEDFVAPDPARKSQGLAHFEALEVGHLEDHPLSKKIVQAHLGRLIEIWYEAESPKIKEWVVQFIADAGVANQSVKPIIISGLKMSGCGYLPTLLYLVGSSPDLFADSGSQFIELAGNSDVEVRWRVAWAISNMKIIDGDMKEALHILEKDIYPTTRTYIQKCRERA